MTTSQQYQDLQDKLAALSAMLIDKLGADLIENPSLADAIVRQIDTMIEQAAADDAKAPVPPDGGLAQLVGLGKDAAAHVGETRLPHAVAVYDETVTSERIIATADLYYIYQHEMVGVFQSVLKLQQVFKAGTVRLSTGPGAYKLYQYDRRQMLRYTAQERLQAYRRVFGYTTITPPPGAQPNRFFHNLLTQFVNQVALFFRDKRVSEVVRPRAADPSFGSIAIVRRAGLDLRNNLKNASYGNVNVLRVELLQLLDEAFRILGAEDIRKLFGADNAWDVIEEVQRRYMNRPHIPASQRSRMAITGRNLMRWLAQPHILNRTRAEFEALLTQIADDAEEWQMSDDTLKSERPTLYHTQAQQARSGSARKRSSRGTLGYNGYSYESPQVIEGVGEDVHPEFA
jgi:hypothetical protein